MKASMNTNNNASQTKGNLFVRHACIMCVSAKIEDSIGAYLKRLIEYMHEADNEMYFVATATATATASTVTFHLNQWHAQHIDLFRSPT